MADIRTLKLALLAETKDYIAGLDKADKETRTFSDKLSGALKTAGVAFLALGAAAGAAAIKIGIDGVKAAIEDEKSQASLAKTLENTTKATKEQIKATETYIDKTARATGIADDQLRPSLDRLVRSTKDVTKAQQLQQLALDISAGTGKDLATVSEALSKAYDGNLGALKRIGVPLDESIIKSKDFTKAQAELSKVFEGQANVQAETFAGKMARLKVALDEAKEGIGSALLPILEKFLTLITDKALPFLEKFVQGFDNVTNSVADDLIPVLEYLQKIFTPIFNGISIGFNTVREALNRNQEKLQPLYDLFKALGQFIKDILIPLLAFALRDAFIVVGNIISGIIDFIATLVSAIDKGIQKLQDFIDAVARAIAAANRLPIIGSLIPNSLVTSGQGGKTQPIIFNTNVSGAIDPLSTARQIVKVQSTALATSGLRAFAN